MLKFRKTAGILLLLVALHAVCCLSYAQSKPAVDKAAWAKRLAGSDSIDADTTKILDELVALSPETALEILSANFDKVPSEQVRGRILSAMAPSPRILEILDLALDDPSSQVQYAAASLAMNYSLRYFTNKQEYRDWYRKQAGKPMLDVARESAMDFLARFEIADEKKRDTLLETLLAVDLETQNPLSRLERTVLSSPLLQEAIARRLAIPADQTPGSPFYTAFQLLGVLDFQDSFVQRAVLPLTGKGMPRDVQYRVIYMLSKIKARWSTDALNGMLIDSYPSQMCIYLLQQLVQLGDPHYIPTFISFLDASESGDMVACIGKALKPITGVDEDTTHNRAWWRAWWETNKVRFAPDIREMPFLTLPPLQATMNAWAKRTVTGMMGRNLVEKERIVAELRGDLQTLHFVQQAGYQAPFARAEADSLMGAGILDILAKMLAVPKVGEPIRNLWLTLQFLETLKPDEAFCRKYILPLAEKTAPQSVRFQALMMLGNSRQAWVIDRMLTMLVDEYPGAFCSMIAQTLGQLGEPRVIPTLIGLMEADDSSDLNSAVGQALSRMTGVHFMEKQDGEWWHDWWLRNKSRFSQEVRMLPIPVLKPSATAAAAFHVRRKYVYHELAEDPRQAYWLISPGFIATGDKNLPARSTGSMQSPLGLMVVLASEDVKEEMVEKFWMTAAEKAFKSRYYIAIVLPGTHTLRPAMLDSVPGVGANDRHVREILTDVLRKARVNPARVFLMGAADSGMDAYACSLESQTPFKGFYLLASPFVSARLPPLTHAKGRRYFIEHSAEDKVTGLWAANAARQLLIQNGAKVKLTLYHGGHGYDFKEDPWLTMGKAIDWLETTL